MPLDDDDQPLPVVDLKQPHVVSRLIMLQWTILNFYVRSSIEMITLCNDYSGSQMEKAIKALKFKQGLLKQQSPEDDDGDEETSVSSPKPATKVY